MTEFDSYEKTETLNGYVGELQKKYNVFSKSVIRVVGANLTSFACLLIPLVLIGLIWTDFTAAIFTPAMWMDGVVTVVMYITGETLCMRLGSDGGKLDKDFTDAKSEFDSLVGKVKETGTLLMGVFCEWQIDMELEQAVQYRLRALRMTAEDYEAIKALPYADIEKKFGKRKAKALSELGSLEPIELNESVLLYDGATMMRGGVPISGDQYLKKKAHVIEMILVCTFTGLLTVSIMPVLTEDVSLARIIYTVFKVFMLLVRMAEGYTRGSRAFNTYEVRMLKAKTNYLRQYLKFIEDKTYLKLGDKYGDVSCYIQECQE